MLELAILGNLKQAPVHGYELKKRLADTLGPLWGVSFGSLYPALRRLERTGAIEVVDADAEAGGADASGAAVGVDDAAADEGDDDGEDADDGEDNADADATPLTVFMRA